MLHDENKKANERDSDDSGSDYEGGTDKVNGEMYDETLKKKNKKSKNKDKKEKKSGKNDKSKKKEKE